MRLSKEEVVRRESAIFIWFKKNPKSTGTAMNEALAIGGITGKPEKKLNIKRVYALREQARAEVAKEKAEVEAEHDRLEELAGSGAGS